MNILKKLMKSLINWASNDQNKYCEDIPTPIGYGNSSLKASSASSRASIDDYNAGYNFTVFSANGGKVIRVHTYDPKTDRHISNLYIITDKEDFGEELSHIITRDSLSR